jgi:hypothetical protein
MKLGPKWTASLPEGVLTVRESSAALTSPHLNPSPHRLLPQVKFRNVLLMALCSYRISLSGLGRRRPGDGVAESPQ